MELKYLCGKHMAVRKVSSNRTFMELKSESGRDNTDLTISSNRTFMELKYVCFF